MQFASRFALLVGLLALSTTAMAQGDRENQGLSREQMWPAPTAEDWKKPCLIKWQRTWEDAVAVSKETGKPILICINMDGETASEHYAGIRYRQPEVAKLYEQYVCVIASVYRHNPRDYDDQGRRIPCPRFGGVTCGEHIWIEPIIYKKFCDGKRVAPRHICVDLEGNEVYDVFYTNDTASVFDAVREGRKKLPPALAPIIRGDRPLVERVASRAAQDRNAVEKAYLEGDEQTRRELIDAARKNPDAAPIDLLRLAIFGLDVDLGRAAREALVRLDTIDATQLMSDALQVPMDDKDRDALIAALRQLGDKSVRARWLAGIHQGLSGKSSTVKLEKWAAARGGAQYPAPAFGGYGRTGYVEDKTTAAEEHPDDPAARIELAEATLALALKAPETWASNPRVARLAQRHLYDDAKRIAKEAKALGAPVWRTESVLALAAYYDGDRKAAYPHAEAAMQGLPPDDTSWRSMAVVTIFAESRWKAIKAAVREGKDWPPEWLTDLHSAYTILLRHPLGTDRQVLWHYELLDWLGAHRRASRVLREGIARFRDSPGLHRKLRERILKWRGPDALEAEYDKLLEEHRDPARLEPFAGMASVAAAELHRKQNDFGKARDAYGRAIAHYERAVEANAGDRTAADAAIALALAGRARVAFDLNDDEGALADLLASFRRDPNSAGTRDGLNITPGETAQYLRTRLKETGKTDLLEQLDKALSGLDQELLRPERGMEEPK